MSEETTHHSETYAPDCNPRYPAVVRTSADWSEVTCGACKLERPLEMPKEYRTPANVVATDAEHTVSDAARAQVFLAETLPAAADLQRSLARTKELELLAVEAVSRAARVLADATAAREAIESKLSALLPGGQGSGVPTEGSGAAKPSQALSGVVQRMGREARPSAPVNTVDIRTEDEYDESMTDKLSTAAQSALINAKAGTQGAKVTAGRDTDAELRSAGLIGNFGGLTREGSIARQRLVQAREDQAFG